MGVDKSPIYITDFLLLPFYLIPIYFFALHIKKKNELLNPVYKYFVKGLFAKILGAVSLCLIYGLYYKAGDTVHYFHSAKVFLNLAEKDFYKYLEITFLGNTRENFYYFDSQTGYPAYWGDNNANYVCRLVSPLCFLGGKSFVITAILLATVSYSGMWRLFLIFTEQFPKITNDLAISVLFIPSVIFWGSGILKDTITISAVGWYTYGFYRFFINKTRKIKYISVLVVSSMLLILIKPYIYFALLPGTIVWLTVNLTSKLNSRALKNIITPVVIIAGVLLGFFALLQVQDLLGIYKMDKVFEHAANVQKDQKQEYYGGNSFDIGDFDGTLEGALGKVHLALAAVFFRPYLWEARNPVMLLSGLENIYLLFLTFFLLVKLKIIGVFTLIGEHPMLFFSVLFALFFGFSVGLSTSNFGSLVRLKIPCIPFFVSSLFILRHYYEKKYNKKLGL